MGIRYLRAVQGRFSVNLRMIPVISCLENRAVALMLHCLSRPFPLPPLPFPPYAPRNVLLPVHSHYFNYERPQWLSSSGRIPQSDLLGGEKMGREGEKGREKNERAPSPLPPICTLITRISGKLHGALTGWTIVFELGLE